MKAYHISTIYRTQDNLRECGTVPVDNYETISERLVITFHRSKLKYRPAPERSQGKRPLLRTEPRGAKRLRILLRSGVYLVYQ
ncbi:hypothetical protein PITC_047620 [Penicillium italicum]|uniref:Uncharacterized protein n=1 Tax=Penicillium italicum TaxID=40296 RepID=A0A0A2LBR4_PENIT|nr:hypothetical protein PITC_047620 [Penicillium italicum]